MAANINITGIQEFQTMLQDLNTNVQKEVMKKGSQAIAKPLIQEARTNINIKRVKKSIGAK
jgi:hypothetical protein